MKEIASKRFLTAFVLVSLVLLVLEKGGILVFSLLLTAALVIALNELYNIFTGTGLKVQKYLGILSGILISYFFYKQQLKGVLALLIFSLIFFSLLKLFSKDSHKDNLLGIAATMTGLLYIGVCGGYLILIRKLQEGLTQGGLRYIYVLLVIIWASDSGAYLIGTKLGKNKLLPAVSPNKTVEGAVGGLITGIIGASFWWFSGIFPIFQCLSFGILISLTGMVGDLFESLIKRAGGVKDSGNLFPGHGGMLDRIDSLLFAAPVWYYYIRFFLMK